MKIDIRKLGLLITVLGVISLVIGAVFIQQGFSKEAWLVRSMEAEKIELPGQPEVIVNSAAVAQEAADTIMEHRRNIAPTYGDLLGGGRIIQKNPTHLSYAQAMNLENYLFLAVTAFGVFLIVKVTGAFMVLTGFSLGIIGLVIRKKSA